MANNLFVSYRSATAAEKLPQLLRSMESLGACVQIQEGFWYINSSKNVLEAKEVIRDSIDAEDTLIIINASTNEFETNRCLREQVESRIRYVWE